MFYVTFLPQVVSEESLRQMKDIGDKFFENYTAEYIGWHLPIGSLRKGPTWTLNDSDGVTVVSVIKENKNGIFGSHSQGVDPKVRFESGFITGELVLDRI
jgi:hypothetical protein